MKGVTLGLMALSFGAGMLLTELTHATVFEPVKTHNLWFGGILAGVGFVVSLVSAIRADMRGDS